ncbi:hypothetical protein GCM10009534_09960 [Kribbella sandramycini]
MLPAYACPCANPQLTGADNPTPRGSIPTTSYRFSTLAGIPNVASSAGIDNPAAPGPPGFVSSTPRLAGLLLTSRDTMMSIVAPPGLP